MVGLTTVVNESSVLQLVICFVIGRAIWDAMKYLFRKLIKLESLTMKKVSSDDFDEFGLPKVRSCAPMPECKPPKSETR